MRATQAILLIVPLCVSGCVVFNSYATVARNMVITSGYVNSYSWSRKGVDTNGQQIGLTIGPELYSRVNGDLWSCVATLRTTENLLQPIDRSEQELAACMLTKGWLGMRNIPTI